jgi:uncharacterized protein YprB with RNaseH-like and TPR domain
MALKDRLNTLRRESGVDPAAPTGNDVARRLERLGAGKRAQSTEAGHGRTAVDPYALAETLGARVLSDYLLCREVDVSAEIGETLSNALSRDAGLPEHPTIDPGSLLFVDTETSGLAGGAGTLAFLVGLLRWEASGPVSRQYLLTGFGGEPALYECLAAEAATAATVVSYNGKSFDAPLLRDRACLNRQVSPLAALAHLDLLAPVRRLFASHWPDCRLATAEARLLHGERTDDLPGDQAPLAWFDFVHRGVTARLPGVLSHNEQDLISLMRLLPPLLRAHRSPGAYSADGAAAARAWLRHGGEDRARELLAECEPQLADSDRLALARLARRRGDLSTAVRIWRELAEQGESRAIEALAKHYEHRLGDPSTALGWARQLDGPEAGRRCRRLEAKRAAAMAQVELGL